MPGERATDREAQEGTESFTAKCETERPARHEQLMEEVCERENCWQAYKRVKANKGSPGIDGMKVGELSGYLKQHWPFIRKQLLRGTYQPQPVRRVEIPKPDGGVRKLWILRNLELLDSPSVAIHDLEALEEWSRAVPGASTTGRKRGPGCQDSRQCTRSLTSR